ncbi:MAG: amylo-alpha-1,6-glucosidase [Oscillospiraceae bacterium]|nr:amylo-alpha-1,6-glucosidase [Oscillospiraceae bacterium]
MKFTNENLELTEAIKKEWLVTNGIGGFSSSTIIGLNTRKYHGLLVAPLVPPARRFLILSKLDESIIIGDEKHNLYTNMCEDYVSDGYKYQVAFEKENFPIFTYQVEKVKIEKRVSIKYLENTVCVVYKIQNKEKTDVKLTLAPVLNFRDFHLMSLNEDFMLKQEIKGKKIKVVINDFIETPVYMKFSEGEYTQHYNDVFKNMYYIEEEKRGFYPKENHVVSGVCEVVIPKGETKEISFICSLNENIDELDVKKVFVEQNSRKNKVLKNSKINISKDLKGELVETLIKATDDFIVYRPNCRLHTVIAGYPWFLDWGRDTLISFEGLFLITKRFNLAKEILRMSVKDIKYGLVPNGYSGFDNRPLYNSVDSGLLLFEQVSKYLKYTEDYKFIKEKIYPSLKIIIENYTNGITFDDNNIYLDEDGLLVSGTEFTQNTWMDAKIGNYVVTPRNGKAVEINALWYNALKIMEDLSIKFGDEEKAKLVEISKKTKTSFVEKFYNKKKKCLYDVLGDSKIRPNQIFALALTHPILAVGANCVRPNTHDSIAYLDDSNIDLIKTIFDTVTQKLLKPCGLKTLAKGEKDYVETYEGDSFRRDMSYHQGPTWVWLLGMYNDAFKNVIKYEKDVKTKKELKEQHTKFVEDLVKTFYTETLKNGCIGQVPEVFDSKAPYTQRGALAQAWSVAELLRVVVKE